MNSTWSQEFDSYNDVKIMAASEVASVENLRNLS